MIYFIRPTEGDIHIKIGYAASLTDRLKGLRREYGVDLVVLGVMDGNLADERAIHERFCSLRIERERFLVDPSLMEFVAKNAKQWDESGDPGLKSLVSLKGTDEFEVWLDELVDHARQGTRSLLLKNALAEYAESHGFNKIQPKR